MTAVQDGTPPQRLHRAALLGGLFALEVSAIALAYQFYADIECSRTAYETACSTLSGLVLRVLVVLGVLALLVRARPEQFAEFRDAVARYGNRPAMLVHAAGVALILVPLGLYQPQELAARIGEALPFWISGAVLAAAGGLFWVAPVTAWWRVIWTRGHSTIPILLLAALVPDLVYRVLPLWNWQSLASLTFSTVAATLELLGTAPYVEPADYLIGVADFYVSVAPQCSGVEGFALVTVFIAVYAFIFRADVRMSRVLLVMLPLALLCSWLLNVFRITALILIGAWVSPEIAVNGFHSYAGWLMFTLLAFGLMALAQTVPWLHRDGARPAKVDRPMRSDAVAAQLLPFAAFMVLGTLVAAVSPHPGLGIAFAPLVLVPVLLYFRPVFRNLDWRPDPLAILAGLAIGIGWIATAPAPDGELERLLLVFPAWALALWAVGRVLMTTLLVPVIEEMFFRGYLLDRLGGPSVGRMALAVGVSSMAFALLHGRWIEAGLAGVLFALVALRRGRVTDAIWAHVLANGLVAMVAAWRGDWSLI